MVESERQVAPICSMRLKNFRRFEDTGELNFSSINFLFGKNSSGKTTLLRAILLLKQFINERSLVGEIPFSGQYVDFGSYRETVFNADQDKDISLSFGLSFGEARGYLPESMRDTYDSVLHFTAEIHWNAKLGRPQFNSINVQLGDGDDQHLLSFIRLGPKRIRLQTRDMSRVIPIGSELTFGTLMRLPFEMRHATGVRVMSDFELLTFMVGSTLNEVAEHIIHIGPLRDMPERAYRIDQLTSSSGPTEHVVAMLVSHRNVTSAISKHLRSLGIAKQIEIVRPAAGYAGIVVSDIETGQRHNLADVGFGLSQVLPIIVRLALAPPRSMVLVEQPELHLHPEVQGELADVMIDLALERDLTLFVESHSENMLLRLRRRIASGRIETDSVRVFVTDRGTVQEASISARGQIDMSAFPKGFFEEEWEEAMEIMRAGAHEA